MKVFSQTFLAVILCFSVLTFAGEYPMAKQKISKFEKAPPLINKAENLNPEFPDAISSAPLQLNSIVFDSARNGYGWYTSQNKAVDFAEDLFGNDWVGAAYRKFVPSDPNTGLLSVAELDATAGFDITNFTIYDYVNNMSPFGIGARYPGFIALPEGPVPYWTQFITQIDPPPYDAWGFINYDFFGWGPTAGGWLFPINVTPNPGPGVEDMWLGSSSIYKDPTGTFHYGGIWECVLNSGDYTWVHGTSSDLMNWTWDPTVINWDTLTYAMNGPIFYWGNNGFGAWMSSGHYQSGSEDFKIMYCTTTNYGQTWSAPDTLNWDTDLGIPTQIVAGDSIYVPDPNVPGDTLLYVGPATNGVTYDFDMVVLPNNDMHFAGTLLWGPVADPAAGTYYPHGKYMGFYDVHSEDQGATWDASRIFWNAGLLVGDTLGDFVTTNEIDIAYDDQNNLYTAWVDRDRVNPVVSPFPRRSGTDYNLDIWTSMSTTGGSSWSIEPNRITDDQTTCATGLKLSTRTKYFPADTGKIYLAYQIADLTRPLAGPTILGDHVQWYYMAEATGFPPAPDVSSISGNVEYAVPGSALADVTLNLSGGSPGYDISDASGYYEFPDALTGLDYAVTPSKMGGFGSFTIGFFDASLIARHAVGLITLDANQQRAADVDKNTFVQFFDAANVARFAVGLPALPGTHAGEWEFDPASHTYNPLSGDMTNQDYSAFLLGDVDGNYPSIARGLAKSKGKEKSYSYLPELKPVSGEELRLPIRIGENAGMYSAYFEVEYPTDVLTLNGVNLTASSQDFQLVANTTQPGILKAGLYGTRVLNESGEIAVISFTVKGAPGSTGDISMSHFQINNEPSQHAQVNFRVNSLDGSLVTSYDLLQNYPNPFNPTTTIKYQLANKKAQHTSLQIYNITGQLVRTLVDGEQENGKYTVIWNGLDNQGHETASGVYFYRLTSGDFVQTNKLLKMK